MKYLFNPEDYGFHNSNLYPELRDFFGPNTFVKVIAEHEGRHFWYSAVKISSQSASPGRYDIYSGAFTKGYTIEKQHYPRQIYSGLISNQAFAEELFKHLMGTWDVESVQTVGKERLKMKCLYLEGT